MKQPFKFTTIGHPSIEMSQLARIEDPIVICEGEFKSTDGEIFWVYTLGGTIDGERIEMLDHVSKTILGATVADDVIIIHAKSRKEADWLAMSGLDDTIASCQKMDSMGLLEPSDNSGIVTEAQVRPRSS